MQVADACFPCPLALERTRDRRADNPATDRSDATPRSSLQAIHHGTSSAWELAVWAEWPSVNQTLVNATRALPSGTEGVNRSARGLNLACCGDLTSPVYCGSWRVPPRLEETRDRRPPGTKKNRSLVGYGSFRVAGGGLARPGVLARKPPASGSLE